MTIQTSCADTSRVKARQFTWSNRYPVGSWSPVYFFNVTLLVHLHGPRGLCADVINKAKNRPLARWGLEPGTSHNGFNALAIEPLS